MAVDSIPAFAADLSATRVATEAAVRVLDEALESQGDAVLKLLETLGTNLDVSA